MKKNRNDRNALKNLALISQVGISVITPILIGVFLGGWIDKWLGTEGVFMLILLLLGAGGGFLNLFKITGAFKGKRK